MKRCAVPGLSLLVIALGVGFIFSQIIAFDLRAENRTLRQQLENFTTGEVEPVSSPTVSVPRMKMQRVGNTWRLAGPQRSE